MDLIEYKNIDKTVNIDISYLYILIFIMMICNYYIYNKLNDRFIDYEYDIKLNLDDYHLYITKIIDDKLEEINTEVISIRDEIKAYLDDKLDNQNTEIISIQDEINDKIKLKVDNNHLYITKIIDDKLEKINDKINLKLDNYHLYITKIIDDKLEININDKISNLLSEFESKLHARFY
jgi:hypothetical protein